MKTVRTKLSAIPYFILALISALTFTACSAGYGADGGYGGAAAPDGVDSGSGGSFDKTEGGENGSGSQTEIVKQLTGAEWRDAQNYDFWLSLFEQEVKSDGQEGEDQTTLNGIFYEYAKAPRGLDTFDMHEVLVTCGGNPVANAEVKLYNGSDVVYSAVSDSAGKAYVFGTGTELEATSGSFKANAAVGNGVTNIELSGFATCESELEIMLVVDTTGSMGDELSFLCDELASVVTRVSTAVDCTIRLGLLFYRDTGDDYVTRKFGFTDVTAAAGLNEAVGNIKAQNSSGGGDYPEAVDTALSEAVAAEWHTSSKTRLIFHILDAPYHDEQENQSNFSGAVKTAAQKGIRIIPVAASGLDTLGQYIMRSTALMTGGTYAFLTDDSGIGDVHELPEVGEYTVEYLSDLMVRLTKGYYTGTFDAPVHWKQSDSVE